MNTTFDRLYRQLGKVTFGVLVTALVFFGLTLVCALLGFSVAVASLRGATASIAYVFVVLFGLFLMTSVAAAVIRWLDRRSLVRGPSA